MVLFLFLTHLGIGVAFTLALVSRQAGVKFFRFNGGLAAAIIAAGLLFQPVWPADAGWPAAPADAPDALRTAATASIWTCFAALFVYWLIVGRRWPSLRPVLLYGAIGFGLSAILAQSWLVAWDAPSSRRALTALSFLTSALFLGGASTSMILGHWYLVIPSLDVAHLQSIVKVHLVSIVLRVLVVATAVAVGWDPTFRRYILSVAGVFFWQRVLFGLIGPAVLAVMTWETAKIRSTQSATGILYVDLFAVIVGEVLAKYLLLETHVPV